MNRSDFQKLAHLRLTEAKVLLDSKCYEGAYYLTGYAVECGLKACIAKKTQQYDFPIKDSHRIYVHDLNGLLKLAGLEKDYQENSKQNEDFKLNWAIVKDWKEDARYSLEITIDLAQTLFSAVTDGKDRVMPWLQKWW